MRITSSSHTVSAAQIDKRRHMELRSDEYISQPACVNIRTPYNVIKKSYNGSLVEWRCLHIKLPLGNMGVERDIAGPYELLAVLPHIRYWFNGSVSKYSIPTSAHNMAFDGGP